MAEEQRDLWGRLSLMLQAEGVCSRRHGGSDRVFRVSYLKTKELADTESRERMQAYETNVASTRS